MRVIYSRIFSPALGRDMWVNAYGHFGAPVIVFPSAGCSADDWSRHGMVHVLAPAIEAGLIKLYCTQSLDNEVLLDDGSSAEWRAHRLRCYEDYVINNLVPAVRFDCRSDQTRIACSGCSTGGLHVANMVLKRPDIFHYGLAMSGKYDLARLFEGYGSMDAYFSDPLAYLYNMNGGHLEFVRRNAHLALVVGQGNWEGNCLPETRKLGALLAEKGISHETDVWGHDSHHRWDWWQRQVTYHFGKTFGWPW